MTDLEAQIRETVAIYRQAWRDLEAPDVLGKLMPGERQRAETASVTFRTAGHRLVKLLQRYARPVRLEHSTLSLSDDGRGLAFRDDGEAIQSAKRVARHRAMVQALAERREAAKQAT